MGYVTSGEFEENVREIFGPLKKKKRKKPVIDFDRFDTELAEELSTLHTLLHTYDFPKLAGLRWSSFVSVPDQIGANEEKLREYGVEDPENRALFLNSIEVFNYSGDPVFTVCDEGVCTVFSDPFEIGLWHGDFECFLSFLVWLSAASNGHTPLSEVEDVFEDEFEIFEGEPFLENAVEAAHSYAAAQIEMGLIPTGLSFLFTGKLSSMTRADAQKRVIEIGGEVAKSVNKNLDVLVIGDDGSPLYGEGSKGSKHQKADSLVAAGSSLKIISETDFLKLTSDN